MTKNPLKRLWNYLLDSKEEMKKVTWPSKAATTKYSVMVIAMSVGIALLFAVLDFVFNLGLQELIKLSA